MLMIFLFCFEFEFELVEAVMDRNKCKLTHTGVEYAGNVKHTDSQIPCQRWNEQFPHWPDPTIKDEDFVDGSKTDAKNYCRNPLEKFPSPWCYTLFHNVSDELCAVPLCSSDCRITVIGSEYSGSEDTTLTNRRCLNWSEKLYRLYSNKTQIKTSKRTLEDTKFPDGSRKKAQNRCRNPTGDINGPWCLVQEIVDGKKVYEKEYCNVDFCSVDTKCYFATTSLYGNDVHNHFIKLRTRDEEYFHVSTLLWNASDFNRARERIAFVASPFLLSGENLRKMDVGLEVVISNGGIAFTPSEDESQQTPTPRVLSATKNTTFFVQWLPKQKLIKLEWGEDPLNIHSREVEYESGSQESILVQRNYSLSYYSVIGNAALWSYSCSQERVCEEHVTLSAPGSLYKKMSKKSEVTDSALVDGFELQFYVRSKSTIFIEYRYSPVTMYPYFRFEIFGEFNKSTISLVTDEGSFPVYLASATIDTILSEWYWSQFSISMYGEHMNLVWWRQLSAPEIVFDISHPLIRNTVWYTFSSIGEAFWLFNCSLSELPNVTKPEQECTRSKSASDYTGVVATASDGQQCLPWVFPPVLEVTKDFQFKGGKRIEALNHCRNPNDDPEGPYCYVADQSVLPALQIKKQYCDIPECVQAECKLSGIGLEYEGNVNTSRSNRTCILSTFINTNSSKRGFCRNPDHNVFGPWCNTTDQIKQSDLCYFPDCYVDDSCLIILNGTREVARRFLIHPDWIVKKFQFKAKIWDPTADNGITINLMVLDPAASYFYSLKVGAQNLTHIELSYVPYNNITLLTQNSTILKTNVAPKLIPKGFWQGFWLRLPPNAIEFGYEGSESAIFSWLWSNDTKLPISPSAKTQYVSFNTLGSSERNFIGLNFPCSYCLIEKTLSYFDDAYYPINLWMPNAIKNSLTLHMRVSSYDGSSITPQSYHSSAEIHLYESKPELSRLIISINYTSISLLNPETGDPITSFRTREPLLKRDRWTSLKIEFTEDHLEISYQLGYLLKRSFPNTSFTFYYFSVHGVHEVVTWLANCPAPDIDYRVDGGWGEWSEYTCSASCGGGFGYRERECNNPKPSYQGYPCLGSTTEDGSCNQYDCGCLNPATVAQANRTILKDAKNFQIDEYKSVVFHCDDDILMRAKNESPASHVQWLKDGFRLDHTRLKLENTRSPSDVGLKLNEVSKDDAGIYMCVIYPDCLSRGERVVAFTVISLAVNNYRPHSVRETRPLRLACNSVALQFVFSNLSASWYLNNFLYKNFTITELNEVNYDVIKNSQPYHEGLWECHVEHRLAALTWTTSRMNVEVLGPPTLYTYLTEEDALKILFGGWPAKLLALFLFALVALDIAVVTYIVYWYWKTRNELLALDERN